MTEDRELRRQARAISAASRASSAAQVLIEHARPSARASDMDALQPVENLLIAAKLTIELQHGGCLGGDLGALKKAIDTYLEEWRRYQ